jgi:hypothetical protein
MVPLVLKPNKDGGPDDYHVMHGDLRIGQIYRRQVALRPETDWLWALNGVAESTDGLAISGLSANLDEAVVGVKERWAQWLAWARLTETD